MMLLVPDEFRTEVLSRTEADMDKLRATGIALSDRGLDVESIRTCLQGEGWSYGFADWYAARISLGSADIELRVARTSGYEESRRVYEAQLRRKVIKMRTGIWMVIGSVVFILFTAGLLGADISPETHEVALDSTQLLIVSVAALMLLITFYVGLCLILDSKGRSRWWAVTKLWVFFLADHNRLVPPTKTEGFSKVDNAALSDW